MHSPPQLDRDLKGAMARKMKVFDGYGSKKRHAARVACFQCQYGGWLTSESVEEEKQTGKQRSPWHCYHQPLIGTRPVDDSSTVTGQSRKSPSLAHNYSQTLSFIAQVLRNRGKGLAA